MLTRFLIGHSGNAEDDEPDKIAIAFGRFGRFKRFIVGSVKGFFLFIKNKIVQLFTGRRSRYDEDTFEVDEKVKGRYRAREENLEMGGGPVKPRGERTG